MLVPTCKPGTVKQHIKDIYQKLDVHTRAELATLWERHGSAVAAGGAAQEPGREASVAEGDDS